MRLMIFALYIAIGAMLHAVVVGSQFDWSSAWTFAWLFGWPIMLVVTFGAVILIGFLVAGGLYAAWEWLKTIAQWRERRKTRRL